MSNKRQTNDEQNSLIVMMLQGFDNLERQANDKQDDKQTTTLKEYKEYYLTRFITTFTLFTKFTIVHLVHIVHSIKIFPDSSRKLRIYENRRKQHYHTKTYNPSKPLQTSTNEN